MHLFYGFLLAILVAALAMRAGTLTRSGAITAALSGGLIFGFGGLPWGIILLTFFISSSLLSRLFSRRKRELSEKFSKGSRRDWAQVLANGGLGAAFAIAQALFPAESWPWIGFIGAMAAVTGDTWATELGVLNPTPPRLITNWRPVERGASGAISLMGSLAAMGGALLIGIIAIVFQSGSSQLALVSAIVLGGLFGTFFDSLLGATIQSIYWCPRCEKETERYPIHLCGTQTTPYRGWRWFDNDWVNFAASVVGALVCLGAFNVFRM